MTQSDWCDESLSSMFFCLFTFLLLADWPYILYLYISCLTLLCNKLLVTGRKSTAVSEPKICLTSKAEHIITSLSLFVRLLTTQTFLTDWKRKKWQNQLQLHMDANLSVRLETHCSIAKTLRVNLWLFSLKGSKMWHQQDLKRHLLEICWNSGLSGLVLAARSWRKCLYLWEHRELTRLQCAHCLEISVEKGHSVNWGMTNY